MIWASPLSEAIAQSLTPDLLKPEWRRRRPKNAHATFGHCYVASEALYHLGAKELGFTPRVVRTPIGTHWYLENDRGVRLDPTRPQFRRTPSYSRGRRAAFLTKQPSKRARELMGRVARELLLL